VARDLKGPQRALAGCRRARPWRKRRAKTQLTTWFWAAYLAVTDTHIAQGSTVYTDAYKSFDRVSATKVRHVPRHQASRSEFRRGAVSVVPLVDRAIGNPQQ
jgi:hypothetical protein